MLSPAVLPFASPSCEAQPHPLRSDHQTGGGRVLCIREAKPSMSPLGLLLGRPAFSWVRALRRLLDATRPTVEHSHPKGSTTKEPLQNLLGAPELRLPGPASGRWPRTPVLREPGGLQTAGRTSRGPLAVPQPRDEGPGVERTPSTAMKVVMRSPSRHRAILGPEDRPSIVGCCCLQWMFFVQK